MRVCKVGMSTRLEPSSKRVRASAALDASNTEVAALAKILGERPR